jgi:hypothetical protein
MKMEMGVQSTTQGKWYLYDSNKVLIYYNLGDNLFGSCVHNFLRNGML